jgi:hypothetical protein
MWQPKEAALANANAVEATNRWHFWPIDSA